MLPWQAPEGLASPWRLPWYGYPDRLQCVTSVTRTCLLPKSGGGLQPHRLFVQRHRHGCSAMFMAENKLTGDHANKRKPVNPFLALRQSNTGTWRWSPLENPGVVRTENAVVVSCKRQKQKRKWREHETCLPTVPKPWARSCMYTGQEHKSAPWKKEYSHNEEGNVGATNGSYTSESQQREDISSLRSHSQRSKRSRRHPVHLGMCI